MIDYYYMIEIFGKVADSDRFERIQTEKLLKRNFRLHPFSEISYK